MSLSPGQCRLLAIKSNYEHRCQLASVYVQPMWEHTGQSGPVWWVGFFLDRYFSLSKERKMSQVTVLLSSTPLPLGGKDFILGVALE